MYTEAQHVRRVRYAIECCSQFTFPLDFRVSLSDDSSYSCRSQRFEKHAFQIIDFVYIWCNYIIFTLGNLSLKTRMEIILENKVCCKYRTVREFQTSEILVMSPCILVNVFQCSGKASCISSSCRCFQVKEFLFF